MSPSMIPAAWLKPGACVPVNAETVSLLLDALRASTPSAPLVAVSDTTTQKLLKVLERISKAGLDCGCSPCVGQCRCDEANEINLQGVRDLADRTLAEYRALAGQVAPQATVEPVYMIRHYDHAWNGSIHSAKWFEATEEAYSMTPENMRRKLYATPPTSKATEPECTHTWDCPVHDAYEYPCLAPTGSEQAVADETVRGLGIALDALKFYASGDHFLIADDSAWDTVSGEPANFQCDEAGTATVEDGSLAKLALQEIAGENKAYTEMMVRSAVESAAPSTIKEEPTGEQTERFFMDHGLWHDRVTGQHMYTQDQYDEESRACIAQGRQDAEIAAAVLPQVAEAKPIYQYRIAKAAQDHWLDIGKSEYDADCESEPDAHRIVFAAPASLGEAKAVAPEGWKLVPIQPTPEMIAAGLEQTKRTTDEDEDTHLYRAKGQAAAVYYFMLDAAPVAPVAEALPVGVETTQWIPVEDGEPHCQGQYIVRINKFGHIRLADRTLNSNSLRYQWQVNGEICNTVTHYLPIPTLVMQGEKA